MIKYDNICILKMGESRCSGLKKVMEVCLLDSTKTKLSQLKLPIDFALRSWPEIGTSSLLLNRHNFELSHNAGFM